jgi:hypothetical protein
MDCERFDRRLSRWLETVWGEAPAPAVMEPPRDLVWHASDCSRCARKLAAARVLVEARRLRAEAPPGLDARILERLRLERLRPARLRPWRLPRSAAAGTWRAPVRVLLPVAAGVLLAVAALLVLRGPAAMEPSASVRVLLVLEAPEAAEVSVVGDWNAWDHGANPLDDTDGDGIWSTEIHVRPGAELRYQFLIDGRTWIPDPEAPFQVDDGFGGTASVLQI